MATDELDPITLQVISGALDTIAEEMGHILYRMSFSSIIREVAGFYCHFLRNSTHNPCPLFENTGHPI